MKNFFLLIALVCCWLSLDGQNITFSQTGCNTFTFSYTPTPAAIQWDFGDGQSSNQISPTHPYGNVGTFVVSALVNGTAITQSIVVDDCCANQSISAVENGACCFDVSVSNAETELFTGISFGLSAPGQFAGSYFDPAFWGEPVPPTSNEIRLEYIGAPHIPSGTSPAVRVCLSGDTQASGPLELYGAWTVGPDTICVDTIALSCETCKPQGNTFATNINSVREPDPDNNIWDYNEYGQAVLVADPDAETLLFGGITRSLRNDGILNDNDNLICGMVDDCGEITGTPCLAAPEEANADWMDYQFIDLRNVNINQPGEYLKVGTINRPGINQEVGIAFLDGNDCILNIQDVSQTPNLRETVTDAILVGSRLYIVGNVYRQPAGQIPVTEAFVTLYDINNIGTPPTRTFSLGRHTRAEAITFHNGQLWITGGADEKAFLAELDLNLLLLNTNVYDLDSNPQSSEIGRTIDIDNNGDIVIFGDWASGGVVSGDNRIFLLKLPAIINECPLRPSTNILYDFAGGGEKVVDALVDGREYLLTGTAKVPAVALGGVVPADRVFLSRLKRDGYPIFLRTYEAQQVRQLDRIKESFLMVGTQFHQGPFISQPFPRSTTRADIWLARTDRDGKLADCDCYEDLGFDTFEPDDETACGNATRDGYEHFPVSYLIEKAEVPGVQDYCGAPCGPGGGGDICPPGVCCGYISGYKFEDRNNDGVQDPFDSEICGWTIELYDNLNNLVATTTTNQAGFYSFGGLCDGNYVVRERLENCWIQNYPTAGTYPVSIDANMYRHYQKNFGNKLELDCTQLNALPRFNNQGGTDCSWSLRLDNNVCPDVTLMKITSATPGVTMNATGYDPGFTNYQPRPNTATEIWATGGNNSAVRNPLARGNGLSVVDFDVDYDCDPVPAPRIQKFYVDYYLDLPCSLADQSYCRDSFFLDCSFPCPPQNDCMVEALATKTANPDDLCCYDLSFFIDPVHVDEFTQLEIRPLPGAALSPLTSLDPQYSFVSNTTSLISLVSNTGNLCNGLDRFFPTGTLPSVELCVDGFTGNMPMVEVDFVKCDGAVCSDTLTFDCSPCIEIVNDTLYCDGGDLKYVFDFQNTWDRPIKKLAVNNFAPPGAVFTPDTLFFPAGLPVGAAAGANTICISNVSAPDSLKFDFKALGDDECCFCISNEICKPIPICCDTCESIEYMLTDTIINEEDCCYSLDFYHCTDTLFTAVRLRALNGVTISQQSAGPGWSMYSPALSSNTEQTWFPRPTPIHDTPIPTGWSRTKVNFCLGNYDGGPLPQVVEVEWLGGSDQNVVCSDSLYFECTRPTPDSTCAQVVDTTWTCNPDGSYDLDLDVQVKWSNTAFQVFISDFVSAPVGAVFNPDPLLLNGVFPTNTVVTMPTLNIRNVSAGDSICFDVALADTLTNYVNHCCHVEVCLEVPPCPGTGGTDCEELGIPVYDHDLMGWAAATCFSGFNNNDWQQGINNGDYVMGLIDVQGAATAPRGSNWSPPMQHYPAFRADTLGQIFGLAVDEGACIYVTASSLYGNTVSGVIGFNWGVAGPGGVYKLCPDATGAYHLSNSTSLPNGGSGLGQVTYDPVHQQLFVSNFQDGEIYRLDANTLAPLGPNYDFPGYATAAPAANPDFIALGERVWAVEYNPFDGKLYFSVWGEDQRNMGNVAARNRLYSIDIDPGSGAFVGTASYVLDLPGRDYDGTQTTNNTMPISDLAFSKAGRMLVTERTMSGEHMNQPYVNWPAHGARTFSYEWSGTQWTNARLQHIGSYNSTWNTNEHANSAGGVDFGYRDGLEGCDSMIWNMGDALQFGPQFIYGIQGHEWPGNSNQPADPDYVVTNSLFIDLDGVINSTRKTQYGDVEIFRDPCCGDPVIIEPNDCAQWEADVRAQGFTITQIPNTGDLLITPPAAMTASDWWELDPGCDGQVSVAISGNGTHTFPSGIRWYFCIDAYRVIDGDTCHVAFAYDGLLEVDPPETCLPADDFMALVAERIDIDHLGTRVVINATGLSNNCELTVDFGDDSEIRTYTLEQLPITYDYQESGRFRPEVTVIEYDDNGVECNNSTTATANPDATNIGLKLYPNPNQGRFKLDFHLPQAGDVNVEVFDLTGRKVLTGRHRFNAGQQQLDLDAGHLSPGTYVLRMVGSGFAAAAKFQRVR